MCENFRPSMPTSQEQLVSLLPVMAAMAAELFASATTSAIPLASPSSFSAEQLVGTAQARQPMESTFEHSKSSAENKRTKSRSNRKRGIQEVKVEASSINEPKAEVVNCDDSSAPTFLDSKVGLFSPLLSAAEYCCSPSPKIRKLKLYSMEEKIDIIDYAKVIGNRAAGREFSVAESSIREWRKNEDKLRRQLEQPDGIGNSQTAHQFEKENPGVIAQIDQVLVLFINERRESVDWYAVRDKAAQIWARIAKDSLSEMNISMGWVARFMTRNEQLIPKLAPPIIATSNASNGTTASLSMVKCSSKTIEDTRYCAKPVSSQKIKKPKRSVPSKSISKPVFIAEIRPEEDLKSDCSNSRRKNRQPRRVEHGATLLTTSSTTPHTPSAKQKDLPSLETSQTDKLSSVTDLLAVWLLKNYSSFNGTSPPNLLEGNKL